MGNCNCMEGIVAIDDDATGTVEPELETDPCMRAHEYSSSTLSMFLVMAPIVFCICCGHLQNATPASGIIADWERTPSNAQGMKVELGSAYDALHKRIIAFGGRSENWDNVDETWAYDSSTGTWTNLNPASSPPTRSSHAMVYDPARGKVLLFGGDDFVRAYNDLWEYDFGLNTWVELSPLNPPPARQMHGMAYDEEHEVIILFGGRRTGGGDTFNDTWEYSHRTNSWRSLGPQQSPPVQDHINLAYDAKHKKTVLFSGPISRDQSTIGTWVYDHATNNWSTLTTEHTPTGDHTSLIYNRNAGTMMLFGNSEVTRGLEVWILDLETPAWAIARSFSGPSYREHFGIAYDEDHDVYLLIGGFPNDDNWLLKVQ